MMVLNPSASFSAHGAVSLSMLWDEEERYSKVTQPWMTSNYSHKQQTDRPHSAATAPSTQSTNYKQKANAVFIPLLLFGFAPSKDSDYYCNPTIVDTV
jgi:hypothetical protein